MDSSRVGHPASRMDPIGSMAAGDPASGGAAPLPPTLDEIYRAHFDFVWRSLRRMGVSPRAMDDAAQDVFLVVHRKLATFQRRSSVRTWLFGIVARVAHDHRRSEKRKGAPLRYGQSDAIDSLPDRGGPGPVQRAEHNASIRLLEALLSHMTAEKREVFLLAELEQMTAPEIGEALGVPLTTVYSRLRAARTEFEDALSRHRAEQKEGERCR